MPMRPPVGAPSRWLARCTLAPLVLLVAACGSGPIPGQSTTTTTTTTAGGGCTAATAKSSVTVDATTSLKFIPATACLKAGGTVTWVNTGAIPHTTTDEPALASNKADAALPAGATGWNQLLPHGGSKFTLTLKVPGTYKYFCIPHELLGMVGQITVVS
ncbi:MAG TPA: plastocyanin/azurin family copper-binding protein [Candidatus Dormibacteraeota bacterium]|nr:plastocyanin/azurin family copper-binding protein [Candidatus Dormibacteraeota bacterium]